MDGFLLLAFLFLIAGVIAVPIASRLGLGSVLGYLLAGIAISPILGWLHVDVVSIQHFAEFGVVMMLFLVGLELEPRMLWEMRNKLLGLGGLQVTVTAIIVMGLAMAFGQPWSIALAIGFVFSLSSTAIVLQTLNEKGLMKSDGGQSSFSVLLFQDIAVIPMLAFVPFLALPELQELAAAAHSAGDDGHASLSLVDRVTGWQRALLTVGAIAFVVVVGSYLTRPIFRYIAMAQLRELFTAFALLMVIAIALLMVVVGLSPALGTFLAGVVLANSEYRHELESDIDPFKGLLLGLFFITVGAAIRFDLLLANWPGIVGMTLGVIALKAAVLYILARVFGITVSDRWLFTLAAYNAGPARVRRLRNEAAAAGYDPNVWFQNVEIIAAQRIGRETVSYVSNIFRYYLGYRIAFERDRKLYFSLDVTVFDRLPEPSDGFFAEMPAFGRKHAVLGEHA